MSGKGSRAMGMFLALSLTGAALVFVVACLEQAKYSRLPAIDATIALLGAAIFFGVLRGPIGRAIAAMLEQTETHDPQVIARLEELEHQWAQSSLDQQRIAELEERLEFAERMLSARQIPNTSRMRTPV